MRDALAQILTQVRKIWLNRKWVVPTAILLAAVGWVVVLRLPNVYEAKTRVYVDTQSMLARLLGNIAINTQDLDAEFVQVARQRLLSRPNLEAAVRATDMDLATRSEQDLERLLSDVADRIRLQADSTSSSRSARENIFGIHFEAENPEIAKKMVAVLLDIFIESVLGSTKQGNEQTEQFLDAQIQQYEARLLETETKLTAFKRQNAGLIPGEGTSFYGELQSNRTQYQAVALQLREASRQRDELRRQLQNAGGASSTTEEMSPAEMVKAQQVAQLQAQLAQLRINFTDQHPNVAAIRKRLTELGVDPDAQSVSAPGSAQTDMVAAQLRIELSRVEGTVASLEERAREFGARVARLEQLTNTIPEVEAQMQQLTRDYDIYRGQYQALVQKRESARLTREADRSTDQVLFQVIDPPTATATPVAPNRLMLVSAVFFGALGAAGALGFLLGQVNSTFGDVRELEAATGREVLGSVGMVRDGMATLKHRSEYLAYGVAMLGLVIAFGVVLALASGGLGPLMRMLS